MRINNNISALNANRNLGKVNNRISRTMEKLSSGLRIARAADDSAGLAISEKLRGNIKGAEASARAAQDAISVAQVGEAALEEATSLLTRAKELKVQYTGTSDATAQTAIQEEMTQIAQEVKNVIENTKFNGKNVFETGTDLTYIADIESGSGGTLDSVDLMTDATASNFAAGAGAAALDGVTVAGGAITTISLDGSTRSELNKILVGATYADDNGAIEASELKFDTRVAATGAQMLGVGDMFTDTYADDVDVDYTNGTQTLTTVNFTGTQQTSLRAELTIDIDAALNEVVTARSTFGSYQSRLESVVRSSNSMAENYQAAESRVRDADMATEMVKFTKDSIIQQAAQSMLTQANQLPQSIIGLLQ